MKHEQKLVESSGRGHIAHMPLGLVFVLLAGFAQGQGLDSQAVAKADTSAASPKTRIDAKADTSGFSPEKQEGWVLYNAYVGRYTPDSVTVEFIIQNGRKSIDWKEAHLVGNLKDTAFFPTTAQVIEYKLLEDRYMVRITEKGACYINLAAGFLPPKDPVILPVQVRYAYRPQKATKDTTQQNQN